MPSDAVPRRPPAWCPRSPLAEIRELPGAARRGARAIFARPSGRPDLGMGIVIALALAGPLVFGQATDRAAVGSVAAFAALNTVLSLVPGSARRRLGAAAIAALVNAAAIGLGALVAEPKWLAALTVLVVTPALVFSGLHSAIGRAIAVPATLTLIIGSGLPSAPAGERFAAGLAGGGWVLVVLAGPVVLGLLAPPPALSSAPAGILANHAIRLGLAAAIAVALVGALSLSHGYWLAISVAVVLRPGLEATAERIAQRIAGTLLGSVVGAVVIEVVSDTWALIAIAVVLVSTAAVTMATDYRTSSLLLTAGVLALLDAGHPISGAVVDERLLAAGAGAVLALIALFLWPEPAPSPEPVPQPA